MILYYFYYLTNKEMCKVSFLLYKPWRQLLIYPNKYFRVTWECALFNHVPNTCQWSFVPMFTLLLQSEQSMNQLTLLLGVLIIDGDTIIKKKRNVPYPSDVAIQRNNIKPSLLRSIIINGEIIIQKTLFRSLRCSTKLVHQSCPR